MRQFIRMNSTNRDVILSEYRNSRQKKDINQASRNQNYNVWDEKYTDRVNSRFNSVQSLSHVWLFATPWTAAGQASLCFTVSRSLLKLMSIESAMLSNCLILCCPLLLLTSVFPHIRVFSSESLLWIRWPKYWSFSISQGWLSFRIDWLDLLAVQGTLKSLFQQHSSKASILRRSAFSMVQLSHPYMTAGKAIALTTDLCWQSDVSAF